MCVMHAPINRKTITVSKRYDRLKRPLPEPFDEELLKPDPDFVDERKEMKKQVPKEGFFAKILQ